MPKRPKLVTQYLENIHRQALEEHPELLRDFISNRNGIYALFNKGELYYAGLASSLRGRLKHHLKDRHRDSWDSFSVYLTIGDKHMRELESLLIRVVRPPGNRQIGRFSGADNLETKFERLLDDQHRAQKSRLMGRPVEEADDPDKARRSIKVRATFKGTKYYAWYRIHTGTVKFKKKVYDSLSAAAVAVTKTATNGRWFWQFERSPGEWIRVRKNLIA
jgi:hypothetical protein